LRLGAGRKKKIQQLGTESCQLSLSRRQLFHENPNELCNFVGGGVECDVSFEEREVIDTSNAPDFLVTWSLSSHGCPLVDARSDISFS
jgi:hypothetical protein